MDQGLVVHRRRQSGPKDVETKKLPPIPDQFSILFVLGGERLALPALRALCAMTFLHGRLFSFLGKKRLVESRVRVGLTHLGKESAYKCYSTEPTSQKKKTI